MNQRTNERAVTRQKVEQTLIETLQETPVRNQMETESRNFNPKNNSGDARSNNGGTSIVQFFTFIAKDDEVDLNTANKKPRKAGRGQIDPSMSFGDAQEEHADAQTDLASHQRPSKSTEAEENDKKKGSNPEVNFSSPESEGRVSSSIEPVMTVAQTRIKQSVKKITKNFNFDTPLPVRKQPSSQIEPPLARLTHQAQGGQSQAQRHLNALDKSTSNLHQLPMAKAAQRPQQLFPSLVTSTTNNSSADPSSEEGQCYAQAQYETPLHRGGATSARLLPQLNARQKGAVISHEYSSIPSQRGGSGATTPHRGKKIKNAHLTMMTSRSTEDLQEREPITFGYKVDLLANLRTSQEVLDPCDEYFTTGPAALVASSGVNRGATPAVQLPKIPSANSLPRLD